MSESATHQSSFPSTVKPEGASHATGTSPDPAALGGHPLYTLTENAPSPMLRYDREGRHVYVDPALESDSGIPVSELIGKTPVESRLIPPHVGRNMMQSIRNVLETGKPEPVQMRFVSPDGREQWFENLHVPEYDENGHIESILSIGRDISAAKEQEGAIRELHELKSLLTSVFDALPDLIWLKDEAGRYRFCNSAYEHFVGVGEKQLIGKTDHDVLLKNNADACCFTDKEAIRTDSLYVYEEHIDGLDGADDMLLEIRKLPIRQSDGTRLGLLGIGRDITERQQARMQLEKKEATLREAQRIAKIGSWELEFPGLKLSWSDEIYRIFEIDPDIEAMMAYDHFLLRVHPEDRERLDTAFAKSLQERIPYDFVHRLLMPDGRIKYVHERGTTHYDEHGNPLRAIGTVQDITSQKAAERSIEHLAHHDPLTGLPNRILAKKHAEQAIVDSWDNNCKVAPMFIDLDAFKTINDSLGHSVGDAMLKEIALRVSGHLSERHILSRQGGDEFLMILPEIKDPDDIAAIAQRLLSEFEEPFHVEHHALSVSASIGIAVYPEHGNSYEALLKSADIAMYRAKENGKNGYCFYSLQMSHHLVGHLKIQNDLNQALKSDEFTLHYQPQIELENGRINGAEALIRWHHPQLGMMPPMSFIPVAESSGLIVQIGTWVLEEACRQGARWHSLGMRLTIAVNISAVQFKKGDLVDVVNDALGASGFDPHYLELELTESIMMHDTELVLQTVQNLKRLGVQLSIDDFGTGYSSLAYLKRFAVDKLKIDQSFVRSILKDQEDEAIVRAIVQMAQSLNLRTIAEGVEDEAVLSRIAALGCEEVQGYHFAAPMPSNDFEHYFNAAGGKRRKRYGKIFKYARLLSRSSL